MKHKEPVIEFDDFLTKLEKIMHVKNKKPITRFDDLLRDLELEADSELEMEDSKEFLSEISFLKSLDKEELSNLFRHSSPFNRPFFKFIRLLASNPPESLSTEKVDSILNSLGPISKDNISRIKSVADSILSLDPLSRAEAFEEYRKLGLLADNLSMDDLTYIIERFRAPSFFFDTLRSAPLMLPIAEAILNKSRRLYKGQELLNKMLSLQIFFLAKQIKREINFIRKNYLEKNKPLPPLLGAGFALGLYDASIFWLDILKNPFLQKDIHDAVSSSFVNRRYTKKDALYRKALKRADDRWKNGDPLLHHEMAKDLREKEGFSDIEYNKLKKLLLPVSVPYKKDFQYERMKKRINTINERLK